MAAALVLAFGWLHFKGLCEREGLDPKRATWIERAEQLDGYSPGNARLYVCSTFWRLPPTGIPEQLREKGFDVATDWKAKAAAHMGGEVGLLVENIQLERELAAAGVTLPEQPPAALVQAMALAASGPGRWGALQAEEREARLAGAARAYKVARDYARAEAKRKERATP